MNERGYTLYEELGELARFVENAMNTISDAAPQIASSSAQLPSATAHLSDLNKMTEEGTLEVMRLTELIQEDHSRMTTALSAIVETLHTMQASTLAERIERIRATITQDDTHLTEIMTALSFQDLVAQRVKKLVAILEEVQHKLMELVVVFGLQESRQEMPVVNGVAGELLKQLEESKTTAMKQKVADDILSEFGFK